MQVRYLEPEVDVSAQLDLLDLVETAQQDAAEDLADVEARFRVAWAVAERSGTVAAETAAWRLADEITARTGEGRLVLLERLVPDDPAPFATSLAAPDPTGGRPAVRDVSDTVRVWCR